MNDERLMGEVLRVHPKGFYFLLQPDGTAIFLHAKFVTGAVVLFPGDLVTYKVRQSTIKPDRTEAYDVVLAKRAKPLPPMPKMEISSNAFSAKEVSDAK